MSFTQYDLFSNATNGNIALPAGEGAEGLSIGSKKALVIDAIHAVCTPSNVSSTAGNTCGLLWQFVDSFFDSGTVTRHVVGAGGNTTAQPTSVDQAPLGVRMTSAAPYMAVTKLGGSTATVNAALSGIHLLYHYEAGPAGR